MISNRSLSTGLVLLGVVGLSLAGCGSNKQANTNDPREVAKEYASLAYKCDRKAAERWYDLTTSEKHDNKPREEAIRWKLSIYNNPEDSESCKPRSVPELEAYIRAQQADMAEVVVRRGEDPLREYKLLRIDGQWKVDSGS